MNTLVVYNKNTFEPVFTQKLDPKSVPEEMAQVVMSMLGVTTNTHTSLICEGDYPLHVFKRVKSITNAGTVVDRQETLSEVKEKALKKVKRKYNQVCEGIDPETGKDIYVDCAGYRMNAGQNAAFLLDAGVRLADRLGQTRLSVIRDFNNNDRPDVPIALALQISTLQAADAMRYWTQKNQMVDAISAASTVEEVKNLNLIFDVNTE